MTLIEALETAQVLMSLVGVVLTGANWLHAVLDRNDNQRESLNGSKGLVARIRVRRVKTRFAAHIIMLASGILVVYIRWRYPAVPRTAIALDRDITFIIITFLLIKETINDLFDRRAVGEMVEEETRRRKVADELAQEKDQ